MEKKRRISLIISTYNRGPKLLRTLQSLTCQTLASELFEVVVVNNNSTDDTQSLAEEFAAAHPKLDMRVLFEGRQGLSHARNKGIISTTGDYVVFMDDDEVADKNLLSVYHAFFERHPDAVGAGGLMLPVYESGEPKWMSRYTVGPIAGTLHLGDKERPFPKGLFFIGGNMAIRRSAFERHGLFNPELGRKGSLLLAGEEKELYGRITADGAECYYLPDAIVHHIIPPERLTREYFSEVCYRIGCSERVRTQAAGGYAGRLVAECVKWCAAAVLAAGYFVTMRGSKGGYLLLMRSRITRGLIGR